MNVKLQFVLNPFTMHSTEQQQNMSTTKQNKVHGVLGGCVIELMLVYSFLVGCQAGALREALPAQRALVGLLPTVDHRVSDQVALFGEAAAALRAAERLLPRVTPQVFFQLTEPGEAFVTVRAAEPLLANAGPPGCPHPPHQAETAAAAVGHGGARGCQSRVVSVRML